jgi:hypothetical protein
MLDERGYISLMGINAYDVPMVRHFIIGNTDFATIRGGHAHRTSWQILCHLNNSVSVKSKNINGIKNFALEANSMLVVPPYNWIEIVFEVPNSSLLVLASELYEELDYIYATPSSG